MSDAGSCWKRCSTCKAEIAFVAMYWACNVSTCNRPRTALAFCSVGCWDAHVPMVRHRDAWAEERRAPTRAEWERQVRESEAKERRRLAKPRS
jgi:signal transduction histidine kinase